MSISLRFSPVFRQFLPGVTILHSDEDLMQKSTQVTDIYNVAVIDELVATL